MCERTRQVNAYYDGELEPEARRQFEAHLPECAPCRVELQRLRQVSSLINSAEIPQISAEFNRRLHRGITAPRGIGIVKLAELLTAAAAVVVLLCGGWIMSAPAQAQPSAISTWEMAATTSAAEPAAGEQQQFAQWVVADLSVEKAQ